MIGELKRKFDVPGRVILGPGKGGRAKLELTGERGAAEIYLHGAHVTGFARRGGPPLLFLSERARFAPGTPIRGGVPICFPWFGPRAGQGMHGFARLVEWQLVETAASGEGAAFARLRLPKTERAAAWPPFEADFAVTASDTLTLELAVTNLSPDRALEFEACLHHYFAVGDIGDVTVHGLAGHAYLDKMEDRQRKIEAAEAVRIASQTDRIYLGVAGAVEIRDRRLGRAIRVERRNAASTVLWNPWTTQKMDDFEQAEYRHMICVEAGNVAPDAVTLAPGGRMVMGATLSSRAI
ncbi:MAG TPA: D-hexose-6-phosphate mutarotase [Alphaproteobacteria bacterium]|nr:D-hexose-6-phosphate mutarotase [Alphaproteobacteria bacterium]